jgi:hypothetical protein
MRRIDIDGRLQVTAGASVLHRSRLVEWIPEQGVFVAVPRQTFEYSWRLDVDPVFGRLMCWILFSAGAEFWLKGFCLLRGIEIRKPGEAPKYPRDNIESWAREYARNQNLHGVVDITTFGTLGNLTWRENGAPSLLDRLLQTSGASPREDALITSAYRLLQKSIRNRDAHAYVPNVRDAHYYLVPELFARCFNIMTGWLPDGAQSLNTWLAEAPKFIQHQD